jgi:exopolysaccharide biosynthesis protein
LVSSAVRYSKTPLVNSILTLADVAVSLLHKGTLNQAIGVLANEMINATHSKDRIAAAATLVKELKADPKMTMGIEVGFNEDAQKQIDKTNNQLLEIAKNQRELFKAGHSLKDIQKIHYEEKGEVIDVDVEQ